MEKRSSEKYWFVPRSVRAKRCGWSSRGYWVTCTVSYQSFKISSPVCVRAVTRRNQVDKSCRMAKWRRIGCTWDCAPSARGGGGGGGGGAANGGGGAFAYNSRRAEPSPLHCTFVPTPFIDSAPNIQARTTLRYVPVSLLNARRFFV